MKASKKEGLPPQWKMALLAWIGVWPTSMFVSLILKPTLGRDLPHVLAVGVISGGIVILSIDGACARQIRESPSPLRLAANGGSSEVTIALTEPVRSTRTQLARQFEHTILISFCVVKGTIDSLRDQELE